MLGVKRLAFLVDFDTVIENEALPSIFFADPHSEYLVNEDSL
jgi:hypothetical protein